jgi:hypothetical protein
MKFLPPAIRSSAARADSGWGVVRDVVGDSPVTTTSGKTGAGAAGSAASGTVIKHKAKQGRNNKRNDIKYLQKENCP